MADREPSAPTDGSEIAIVGMAGRFPGAPDIDTFWRNLRDGVESISALSDADLAAAGVPAALRDDPRYVKAAPLLDDIELFDAELFGYTPREAELIDPQQRLFLECSWAALEHAGYAPGTFDGAIGIFGGARTDTYLLNLYANPAFQQSRDTTQIALGNDLAYLSSRVAHRLNLRGPSLSIHTACSTALAAVHLACQSLLIDECQLALAGGVAVNVPQRVGYLYQEGGILAPDGHCRPFDADARGTVFGSGVGVVVLKRLEDALADGDTIYAVIRGSALNNDGAVKASFTAPSVDGQAAVIAEALANAGVPADTIGYIEAHGTGTPLGDPIEIRALTRAFRASTARSSFCPIGSVKSNVGHLDAAGGIAGLIKTALALHHRQIPPSLHFHQPNPQIDFPATPFYVNTHLADWPATGAPRRAGVSSFGFGGTNVHVVLEEAPSAPHRPAPERAQPQLLVLSAKTAPALALAATRLAAHLDALPDLALADVAFTLQAGRQALPFRHAVAAHTHADASAALRAPIPARAPAPAQPATLAFLLPGQGAQAAGMGLALAQTTPALAQTLTLADRVLLPLLGRSLHAILADPAALAQTALAQPALLALEYALAHVALAAGLRPAALLGHSLGELTAATLAGVFSFPDALALAVTRGRLLEAARGGQMLAVALAPDALAPWLAHAPALDLAAVNGPQQCVLSGPAAAVATLAQRLAAAGITTRVVQTDYAFHSAQLDGAAAAFSQAVAQVRRAPPQLPLLSNVHGAWLDAATAQEPAYWGQQLRAPVQFAAGLDCLVAAGVTLGLEVGPGQVLRGLAGGRLAGVALLPRAGAPDEAAQVLAGVGEAWVRGAAVAWEGVRGAGQKRRVGLPTYPFARQRFWVEPQPAQPAARGDGQKRPDPSEWLYLPAWKPTAPPQPQALSGSWLIFADGHGLGEQLALRLEQEQQDVVRVAAGQAFRAAERLYTLNPQRREDYAALLADLRAHGRAPGTIVHLWALTADDQAEATYDAFEQAQPLGMFSLLALAQALGRPSGESPARIVVVANRLHAITAAEPLAPEKATLLGPCKVIPQEYPGVSCQSIDVVPAAGGWRAEQLAEQLLAEIAARTPEPAVAYRGRQRWAQSFEPAHIGPAKPGAAGLRERGVYMITGGLGAIGLAVAEELARAARARLVLLGRAGLPAPEAWEAWLAAHDADEPTSRLIARLRAIEALGAEVLVLRADVADAPAMRAVLQQIDARFSALHGVIHSAGVVGARAFGLIEEAGPAECAQHFQAKVRGTLVLSELLRERRLDFCLLQSSLAAVLGGLGLVAYAAANLFLDAFAQCQNQRGPTPWISVNWDAWQFDAPGSQPAAAAQAALALTPAEGVATLRAILAAPATGQLIVSTGDLEARAEQWLSHASPGAPAPSRPEGLSLHPRPQLQSAYLPPEGELEQAVAGIWQQLLGIEQVGANDNFFELGGHSLLATELAARLRQAFDVDVSLRSLYEAPTVAGLARAVEDLLIAEIEGMAEEDVLRSLGDIA